MRHRTARMINKFALAIGVKEVAVVRRQRRDWSKMSHRERGKMRARMEAHIAKTFAGSRRVQEARRCPV